jgi:hypothetical protein
MEASTRLAASEPEPSPLANALATFLPLLFIAVMFLWFVRWMRRATARAEESMQLARETVAELRAIRAALEPAGRPKATEPKPTQTLSGQTLPTR